MAAPAWTALKRYRGDIQGVKVFITLVDYDSRWGVFAGGNDGNQKQKQ